MFKAWHYKFSDEGNKSSNGNSADTEGEEESEIGDKSLDDKTAAAVNKLHHQPVADNQDKHRKHDPNRYMSSWYICFSLFKCREYKRTHFESSSVDFFLK